VVEAFLSHLQRRVFPGGCFFATVASELDTRPGPVRDRVVQVLDQWQSLFRQCIIDAQSSGEIGRREDVAQTAFEIQAMLLAGNFQFVLSRDPMRLTQARAGVEDVLARIAAREQSKKNRSARRSR
jgi:hypothetical protein